MQNIQLFCIYSRNDREENMLGFLKIRNLEKRLKEGSEFQFECLGFNHQWDDRLRKASEDEMKREKKSKQNKTFHCNIKKKENYKKYFEANPQNHKRNNLFLVVLDLEIIGDLPLLREGKFMEYFYSDHTSNKKKTERRIFNADSSFVRSLSLKQEL